MRDGHTHLSEVHAIAQMYPVASRGRRVDPVALELLCCVPVHLQSSDGSGGGVKSVKFYEEHLGRRRQFESACRAIYQVRRLFQ